MGFFSFECKGCGHSILSDYAVDKGENEWMKDCVAVAEDGSILRGEYDGYGRVGSWDDEGYDDTAFYHKHCWELMGKPTEFDGASDHAADQGYFFDPGTHTVPKFKTVAEMEYEKKRYQFAQDSQNAYYKTRNERQEKIEKNPNAAVAKIRFTQEVTVKHEGYYSAESVARNVMVDLKPTTNDTSIDWGERRFEVLEETPAKFED